MQSVPKMKEIIVAKNVSKKYCKGAKSLQTYGFSDLIKEIFCMKKKVMLRKGEFWALKNISLKIEAGDTFALIGSNGSGKSTFLKILAGLINFDEGKIEINGKIQALINLSAGFNNNLSGRENIYNIAAVIGLNRIQTKILFNEIVDFSELDGFIDQPVETYSSGMKARLGFSIVSHMNPDILLVDEVLSVGDMAFQNKCKLRMEELKSNGVTMILVSHSMSMVRYFCQKAVWIDKGRVKDIGTANDVCSSYEEFILKQTSKSTNYNENIFEIFTKNERNISNKFIPKYPSIISYYQIESLKNKKIIFQANQQNSLNKKEISVFRPVIWEKDCIKNIRLTILSEKNLKLKTNQPITVVVEGEFIISPKALLIGMGFYTKNGLLCGYVNTNRCESKITLDKGPFCWVASVPQLKINPGKYIISLGIMNGTSYFHRLPMGIAEIFEPATTVENFIDMSAIHEFYSNKKEPQKIVIPKDIIISREEWS